MPKMAVQQEGGFALLLVFAMAASASLLIYLQLPRVAFEAQRNKEQLLHERGEQYIRGIQLFTRKFRRYPATIDELEKTNNTRFLRKRYKDPMTGKDEWRLIHAGMGGILTDSLIKKKEADKDKQAPNTFTGGYEQYGVGAQPQVPGGQAQNPAANRDLQRGTGGMPTGNNPADPNQPGAPPIPGIPGMNLPPGVVPSGQTQPGGPTPPDPSGQLVQPGQPNQPGQPGQPVQPNPNGNPNFPGQNPNNPNFNPNYQPNNAPLGGSPILPPGMPGMGPVQPGVQPAGSPNPAVNGIVRGLTGGTNGPGMPMMPGVGGVGMQLGPGIAGIASKHEGPTIMVYKEQTDYKLWEFVYDPKEDKMLTGGQQATMPGNNDPLGRSSTSGSSQSTTPKPK